LLAAGLDSRAFRLAWPPETAVWEVDQPDLLALKAQRLGADAQPRCGRETVAADLTQADWPERLTAAGLDPTLPSAWLAEGFFEYLDAVAVERVLAALSKLAARGSRLGTDFVSEDFLAHPWMGDYLRALAERGMPWRFGTNTPETLLARHGWQADVRQPGEAGADFGRWPWPVAPRETPGLPRSFLVTAVYQATSPRPAHAAGQQVTGPSPGEQAAARPAVAAGSLSPTMSFVPYDARYPHAVAQLAEQVQRVLPGVHLEHVGSTAVPGLGGRQVLDVVIPSVAEDHDRIRRALLSLGFADFPFAHVRPMLQGQVRYDGEDFPVLLYVLPPDHAYLRGWRLSRDYLCAHPDEAHSYAEVKRRIIAEGNSAPWAYQQAKAPYLEDLARRVAAERPPDA
jgi:GrpB-like predicted nucleotidyltransferase (UPF0157 family)